MLEALGWILIFLLLCVAENMTQKEELQRKKELEDSYRDYLDN